MRREKEKERKKTKKREKDGSMKGSRRMGDLG